MLGRLILGIVKGLILGGLVGFGLAKLGFAAPGVVIAYLAAAVTGVLIGLVAGKPIRAKDAKIEAGMKALVGALLGAGLMYAARRWLTMTVPLELGPLGASNDSLNEAASSYGTVGGMALTSLAVIAALLGGFYEADNTPGEPGQKQEGKADATAAKKRIAAAPDEEEEEVEGDAEAEKKQQRTKR